MSAAINISVLRKANVYLRNELAGYLEKSENRYRFTYTAEWIQEKGFPIGLALPLSDAPFVSDELFPFFDNLIPEGWLLSSVTALYKIDRKNRFALLLATGQETIGAVKVIALDEKGKELISQSAKKILDKEKYSAHDIIFLVAQNYCSYCLRDLTASQVKKQQGFHDKCAREMWATTRKIKLVLQSDEPMQSFRDTIRGASVSGAQKKGLFSLQKNELIPATFGSTYILKPPGDFPHLPENEHLTMAIAKAVGFDTPPFAIFKHDKLGYIFAIKRFDITKDGQHLRVEDAGQVLGYSSEDKYDSSYEELAQAIEKYSDAPKPDLVEMWKRLIFCFLTANGDMHVKNWSFIEKESLRSVFRLSPCYDFLNTRLAIGEDEVGDLALDLFEGKKNLSKKLFLLFAKNLDIESFALKILDEVENWTKVGEELCHRSFLPEPMKKKYIKLLRERCNILTS
jgi:serine/threonine-protein kinase HipA